MTPSPQTKEECRKIFEKGLSIYSKKDYTSALPYFKKMDHREFEVLKYYHLGLTYIQLGQFENGLTHYRKIHEIPPSVEGIEYDRIMYSLYINMGSTLQVLARRKQKPELFEEAITCYTYALQIKDFDPRVWNNLGNAYLDMNKFQDAIRCFNKAIKLDDEFPEAYYSLSLVYESMKMYEKAVEVLKKGLRWKARNKTYLNRIAGLTFGLGNFQEAKEYAKRAVDVKPDDLTANKNLSLILYNLGEYEEAFTYYQKLLLINPEFKEPEVEGIFEDLKKKIS
ncbi:hypothetical protein NEF87_004504 [Candidatus Lokiarchaeum ossiferum]|uniref:Tetratricopeptide repeat protein n=1 Tax=Candidatus Lokiarchaeum ossiferum TaxID=2951803 RepID=A0ABY6HXG0_9ARCH|nr:hypothetical protein NEF87_004504 [Candidatus Lokiarchaeum sp. B-35]